MHAHKARGFGSIFYSGLEHPTVQLHQLGHASVSLTTDEARRLAELLIAAADEAEAK